MLMANHGDDAYSLAEKSGVPQPTTHRFLSGKHGDPRSSTVKKWASAYGITESELRGDLLAGGIVQNSGMVERLPSPHHKDPLIRQVVSIMEGTDEAGRAMILMAAKQTLERYHPAAQANAG